MCKLTKNLPIRIQGGDFGKGEGKFRGAGC